MESDPREPLLPPGTGKNSPADEGSGSGSGADISETSRSPARPSPTAPPPPPVLGLGMAKKTAISSSSSSPPLPPLTDQDVAKNQSASLSSHSLDLGGLFDTDLEAHGQASQQPPPASPFSHGETSNSGGLGNGASSSSPSSGAWWLLFGRLRRRAPPRIPVSAPRGSSRRFDGLHKSIEELRHVGPRLDSVGVERVIGVFGFSLFGSLSLFPSTIDRIKDFTIVPKSFVMFGFGVIWVLASVGVMSGLHGKSDFEQTFCRVTGRLSMLGLAVLVALHVWWTFPSDNISCIVGFSCLVFLAVALHLASFVWSFSVGEDRIEDKASSDAQE